MFKQPHQENQEVPQKPTAKVSLFGKKKPANTFCSVKDLDENEKKKQEESNQQYENYLKVVK